MEYLIFHRKSCGLTVNCTTGGAFENKASHAWYNSSYCLHKYEEGCNLSYSPPLLVYSSMVYKQAILKYTARSHHQMVEKNAMDITAYQ